MKSNPNRENNQAQWDLYNAHPKEKQKNIVSESVTIYGEAPSGSHVAEPFWVIWKETKDENGRINVDYAQDGSNTLRWIYNTIAFDPVPDVSGRPYHISLDNSIVYDGMSSGLPVANITVLDVDDVTHTITIDDDPTGHFVIVGNVLQLADSVQLADIAYPLVLRATDDDGKYHQQTFAIYVQEMPPVIPAAFLGELLVHDTDSLLSGGSTAVASYMVPAERALRLKTIDCFGQNKGRFYVEVNGSEVIGDKETYYTYFETAFDLDNYELDEGDEVKVYAENKGTETAKYTVTLRGYQYAT